MKVINILLEYNRATTAKNYSSRLVTTARKDRIFYRDHKAILDQEPEELAADIILSSLEVMDPTSNKQYMLWIVNQYIRQEFRIEDSQSVRRILSEFYSLRTQLKRMGKTTDINQYSWNSLYELIDSITQVELDTQSDQLESSEVRYLYQGPYGTLVVPLTERASCELGRGTRWCTAARENNMFDDYSKDGPLYIWIDRSGDKYQFHFESYQFMDSSDTEISEELIQSFRTSHPVLSKLFKNYEARLLDRARKNNNDVEDLVHYASRIIRGRWREAESIIFTSSDTFSKTYYLSIAGRDDTDLERYIEDDPDLILKYALQVIGGRWLEKEPILLAQALNDPKNRYIPTLNDYIRHTRSIIPEFEDAIVKRGRPEDLLDYGRVFTKITRQSWDRGREILINWPNQSYSNLSHVLKRFWEYVVNFDRHNDEAHRRWPAYEEFMTEQGLGNDALYYSRYVKVRLPVLEPLMFRTSITSSVLNYYRELFQGKNQRLPELEKAIADYNGSHVLKSSDALDYMVILNSAEKRSSSNRHGVRLIEPIIRIPEMESIIFQYPENAVWYAFNLLKTRIPEAEPRIARDPESVYRYTEFFGISIDDLKTS